MEFQRTIIRELDDWRKLKNRKPLLVTGARQVGKTTVVKQFAKEFYKSLVYINFDDEPHYKELFANKKDPERLLKEISVFHGAPIVPGYTLLFLDEIQECNDALNSLKYFYEKAPEYHIIGAGSLLGVFLGRENTSFPVGKVDMIKIYPLTFMEYILNVLPNYYEYLQGIRSLESIPDLFFNQILEHFKIYMIIGGMPEPLSEWIENKNLDRTEKTMSLLLDGYSNDFAKHAPKNDIIRIQHIWDSIPTQLGKENKKFLFKAVKPGARARDYEDALLWLIQAGLLYKIYRNEKPNIPLKAYDDLSAYKIYILDTGLLRRHARLDSGMIMKGHLLFTEFKGSLAENFVAQSLMPLFDLEPRYWESEGKAEIDFLIQYKNAIIPIEVKSSTNTKSKSLTVYTDRYQPKIRIRYSLNNLSIKDGLINIPLFMADITKNLIDTIL